MVEEKSGIKLESALFAGFIVTLLLSFALIAIFSSNKDIFSESPCLIEFSNLKKELNSI